MAGISTATLAAAVSNAGGLGSIGVGNVDAETAPGDDCRCPDRDGSSFQCQCLLSRSGCCRPHPKLHCSWPGSAPAYFSRCGAGPEQLREIYTSFVTDDSMLAMLVEERPQVVSFHFGLPAAERIAVLRKAGIVLFATATNLYEGRAAAAAGIDAVVAQGFEAGGHRGVFDPAASDA